MQVTQLPNIKEKILGSTMPKYMSTISLSNTIDAVKIATMAMIRETMDVVYPNKKFSIKDNVEPQSELEDNVIDLQLLEAIIKEVREFNESAKNIGITQEEDLIELKATRDML